MLRQGAIAPSSLPLAPLLLPAMKVAAKMPPCITGSLQIMSTESNVTKIVYKNVEHQNLQQRGQLRRRPCLALSTSCSKFREKLLLFWNVANLNFNHAHIH